LAASVHNTTFSRAARRKSTGELYYIVGHITQWKDVVKLEAGIVVEPELTRAKTMGDETQLVVYKPNGIEMMDIAASFVRVPLRPQPGCEIIDCNQVVVRASYPETVIETGYPVNVAQREWRAQFFRYFQIGVKNKNRSTFRASNAFILRTLGGVSAGYVQ
jgi:hypothetical protein